MTTISNIITAAVPLIVIFAVFILFLLAIWVVNIALRQEYLEAQEGLYALLDSLEEGLDQERALRNQKNHRRN
ncbi:unnamed protein product [Caenorhabditis brenneri]